MAQAARTRTLGPVGGCCGGGRVTCLQDTSRPALWVAHSLPVGGSLLPPSFVATGQVFTYNSASPSLPATYLQRLPPPALPAEETAYHCPHLPPWVQFLPLEWCDKTNLGYSRHRFFCGTQRFMSWTPCLRLVLSPATATAPTWTPPASLRRKDQLTPQHTGPLCICLHIYLSHLSHLSFSLMSLKCLTVPPFC